MNAARPSSHRTSIPPSIGTWLLIGGLFLLRIVLAGIVPAVLKNPPQWILPTYEIGTYILTVVLIWWERKNLAEFFIGKLALSIMILGKPLELVLYWTEIPSTYPPRSNIYWLYLPAALGLSLIFLSSHTRLKKLQIKNWLWLIIGVVTGTGVGILSGFLLRYQFPDGTEKLTSLLLFMLPIQQLVRAGIVEEPFFRGFLWGVLRRAGWKDMWILLFQTILFTIGHLYYFPSSPISFWIVVPLVGLVLGLLAWHSRSIATSMAGHGFTNGVGQMVTFYRF